VLAPQCHAAGDGRPALEVADIFRAKGAAYREKHTLTPEQARVMCAIETCRTASLGGHLDVCDQCGFERPAYNSCRNRHCPKCQSLAQAAWLEQRKERILPAHYFHIVFTLPDALRLLVLHNRPVLFALLFEAAAGTLLALGADPRHLGALIGFTAVLHTWTRDLRFHPHLHTIVTGGGLRDDGRWVSKYGGRYLFPRKALSHLFRGKFMAGLVALRRAGRLRFEGACADLAQDDVFAAFKDKLYRKPWVVYAKRPFGGAEQVYHYLGRYTHRVGLSNRRLQAFDEKGVRFATKDGQSTTITPEEFIRRFLLHVLPKGFTKIRHFGLLAPAHVRSKLVLARQQLLAASVEPRPAPAGSEATTDFRERLLELTGIDLVHCPCCQTGVMVRHSLLAIRDHGLARPPPEAS
jgi:hypothetical protein